MFSVIVRFVFCILILLFINKSKYYIIRSLIKFMYIVLWLGLWCLTALTMFVKELLIHSVFDVKVKCVDTQLH